MEGFLLHHKGQVASDDAELLGDEVAALVGHHQTLVVFNMANFTNDGHFSGFGNIVAGHQFIVEQVAEVDDANGQEQAQQNAEHADFAFIGLYGIEATASGVEGRITRVGAGGGDGNFFFALQQVEVKTFFYFLLAFHFEEAALFVGYFGEVTGVEAVFRQQVGPLTQQYLAVVANGFFETALYFVQLFVELLHLQAAGGLLAARFFPLQAQRVEGADEGSNGGFFNAQ